MYNHPMLDEIGEAQNESYAEWAAELGLPVPVDNDAKDEIEQLIGADVVARRFADIDEFYSDTTSYE